MRGIIESLMEQFNVDRFSLLGYSFGGKIALCVLEMLPEKVAELHLFAPDGIRPNFWYDVAIHFPPGRWFYRKMIQDPTGFLKIVDLLRKMRLLHEKIHKFLHLQLHDEVNRNLIYNTWMSYRLMRPHIPKISACINKLNIKVKLYYGYYDKVIPPSSSRRLVKRLNKKAVVQIIETGHELVSRKVNDWLVSQKLP